MKKILLIFMLMINLLSFSQITNTISQGNWNNPLVWDNGIPTNNGTAIINHKIVLNKSVKLRNIIINDTLENNGFKIQINRDWINNGEYIDTLGKVKFKGNIHQLNGNTIFYNLEINSNNSVVVNDTILVKNLLKLKGGNLDVISGLLIIYSDTIYKGRVGKISGGANILGNFIFEQWVNRCNGWSLYGGPFDATLNDYADSAFNQMIYTGFQNSDYPTFGWSPNAYLWDENWNTSLNGWVTPNGNNILPRGTGFWYWNSDTIFNSPLPKIIQKWKVATKGSIDFTSIFNFPIKFTNNGDITRDGWNLLSNPYPGTIDWDRNNAWIKFNVDNAIYVFNTCSKTYMSYVGGIGTNGGSRYISPFQGFYIKANNISPVLSSNKRVVRNNYKLLYKTTGLIKNVLRIKLDDDEIIIRENDLSDSLFNSNFDAYKCMYNSKIYSKNYNDTNIYSINTINDNTYSIPIYTIGKGTLNFSGINTWDSKYDLYIEDIVLNTMSSLNIINSYSFTSNIPNGIYINRFVIHLFGGFTVETKEKSNINTNKNIIKIINLIGQEVDYNYSGIRIIIYEDGSSSLFQPVLKSVRN